MAERLVGRRGLAASTINIIVGAGIFVLPATIAARLGAAAPFAYVVCAVAMALIVLCFAESGSRVARTGGTYAYVETAFGPLAGYLAALLLGMTCVLASALVATVFVETVAHVLPVLTAPAGRIAALATVYLLLLALHVRGVRQGVRAIELTTLLKLVPLLALVAAGLLFRVLRADEWHPVSTELPPLAGLGAASLLLIYAFLGTEVALTPSGEVRDPARTIPWAVLVTLGFLAVLYALIQIVAYGVAGPAVAESSAPLALAAGRIVGRAGELAILAAMAVSTFGYVMGDLFASSRLLVAMGERRLLPRGLAVTHQRFRTPHIALGTYAAIAFGLAVSRTFEELVMMVDVATLLVYFACCAATLVLRARNVTHEGSRPFLIPGGPIVPVLAMAIIAWLLLSATWPAVVVSGVVVAAGSLAYWARRRGERHDRS